MDLMLVNMKNDIFPLISTIILHKVLILGDLVHLETLVAIYWNSCVALKYQIEKSINGSQLYNIMIGM